VILLWQVNAVRQSVVEDIWNGLESADQRVESV
jgi:hypothetical protein